MAEHIYTYDNPPSERDLARACRILEDDGVIAYPTGGNWAFGCDFGNTKAIERIRFLKPSHPSDRPFTLICSDIAMVATVANIESHAYKILRKAWPGPFTVFFERNRTLHKQIRDKRKIVGARVPENAMVRMLVERFGRPIASTSVPELPSGQAPHFGYQVFEVFGHAVDLILDLGTELPGEDSTIIDFSSGSPELIRKGLGDMALFGLEDCLS